jgi:two-component system chemotaxis response regulator CheB
MLLHSLSEEVRRMAAMNEQKIRRDIIVLGGSAGSIEHILHLFRCLPNRLEASFFIVVHRSPHFESRFDELIQRRTELAVVEPCDGDPVRTGHVYLAPRDLHMSLERGSISVHRGPKQHFTRPAVDPLFTSAAAAYAERVVGVVYSGGGTDGSAGLIEIKKAGGLSIVQDPGEAAQPSMPSTGIARDDVDAVLESNRIPSALVALIRGKPYQVDVGMEQVELA